MMMFDPLTEVAFVKVEETTQSFSQLQPQPSSSSAIEDKIEQQEPTGENMKNDLEESGSESKSILDDIKSNFINTETNKNCSIKGKTEQHNAIGNPKPVETNSSKADLQRTMQDSSTSHTSSIPSNASELNGSFTIVDINDIMKRTSEPKNVINSTQAVTSSKPVVTNNEKDSNKNEGINKVKIIHGASSTTSLDVNNKHNKLSKGTPPVDTETLSKLLNSLPKLQYNQCYLINLPNKTQLLVRPTVMNTNVLPSNQSALNTSKEQCSTSVSHKSDKTHTDNVKKTKEIKSTNPNPYRCVEVKKSNFKIDSDGFTFFDRLGFFKAEEKRSRRCVTMLNLHIEVRDKLLLRLVEENENKRIKNLSNKQIKQNNRKIKKTKIHVKSSSLPMKKRTVENKHKEYYAKKYKLKDCSIILSKKEVSEYLAQKQKKIKRNQLYLRNKYSVSNLKLPVYHNSSSASLEELFTAASNSLITFVDDNNFELIEKLHLANEKIYFINAHEIVTALYTDIFPVFSIALQSAVIKIVEKAIFNKFLAASTVKQETSTNLKISDHEKARSQDNNKLNAFGDFMIDFHAAQKKFQCETTSICLEHNYSLKTKV
ncbi:hypothetical protein ILUMI_05806 [Ignelater luminosus]|uniref:Uncharacterized protein n=1 Tax=Ignelater luminosus TaxID=2038154 RepID=A0A8K0D6M0_IGNLU|nr:hypothetical protein ILUMI_05806 [Ignelater luminosus]